MSRVGISYSAEEGVNGAFSAKNRYEFEAQMEKIAAFVDLVWPKDADVSAEGFVETPMTIQATNDPLPVEAVLRARAAADRAWREKNGLV